MATASPTPMGSSHFAAHRRQPSRNAYMLPPTTRPQLQRTDAVPVLPPAHTRTYSLNDSSDDEIPFHMLKFSAATNALLNDAAPAPTQSKRKTPSPIGKVAPIDFGRTKTSPVGEREISPLPRRVVRLSGTPSSLRRATSLGSSLNKRVEESEFPVGGESPLDLSTPAQVKRTVRLPVSGSHRLSSGSVGSRRAGSAQRDTSEEPGQPEYPSTVTRGPLGTSQGSVSRYGNIGITRHGEEVGMQSSMRIKRVGKAGLLSGPARRGRRRMTEEEHSPVEEQADGLDAAGSSQNPESQESVFAPDSQEEAPVADQRAERSFESLYRPQQRDFASKGSPVGAKDFGSSVLKARSPPSSQALSAQQLGSGRLLSEKISAYKIPAARIDLPSAHDQENEAPPTFKRNKQAPLIHMDILDKKPARPQNVDIDTNLRTASPVRQPLVARSRNTPLRPAPPPPKMSLLDAATSTAGAAASSSAAQKKNRLKLNGKVFTRLDVIGRGGSSRVYRVMAENSRFFALKRVSLDDADESAVRGFKGEIDLLRKLEHVERVIRLYDYEMNDEKNTLSVLMEMGELDLNKVLDIRVKSDTAKFDPTFVRYYWKEMLECLEAIHACDVVHSDLKPHNFVLVKGQLKLIDFGIANAIQTDETVNVHRDTQIGTPNYMSPESLIDSNAKPDSRGRIPNEPKLMKLGKPSDIWSLGCILYQMVYGLAPFAHISNPMHRCQAIINWKYDIEYPALGVGNVPVPTSLIETMKKCLNRDQHQRPTATQLLEERDPFLNPPEMGDDMIPLTEDLLNRLLLSVAAKMKEKNPSEAEISQWSKGYYDRMKQKMKEGQAL